MDDRAISLRPGDGERTSAGHPALGSGLDQVREALKGIRYGEVRVIVQDGVIVQIERLEKYRLR